MSDVTQSLPTLSKGNEGASPGIAGDEEKRSSRVLEDAIGLNEKEDRPYTPVRRDLQGEPIIETGADVSRYAISPHDTHLPSLTFRSLVLGTSTGCLAGVISQIYLYKPQAVGISGLFLLLLLYGIGKAWEWILPFPEPRPEPGKAGEEGRWRSFKRGFLELVNPGPFGMKEHKVALVMAGTAGYGSSAIGNFAVQRLFYDTKESASTAILATFSTAVFGYGLVGILRPLTVYPSEMVYWLGLPDTLTLQTLHKIKPPSVSSSYSETSNFRGDTSGDSSSEDNGQTKDVGRKRLKLFWAVLCGTALYEVIPQYIFPLLNGISIPCLATQKSSINTRRMISHIFGGAAGNEGLGLFAITLDWQYITSVFLSLPLIFQANAWVGWAICYAAVAGIYYGNIWDSANLPFMSSSIFSNTSLPGAPVRWNQTAVFGPTFTLNNTALEQEGLPLFAGTYAWGLMTSSWGIGGLLAHVILFWGPSLRDAFRVYTRQYKLSFSLPFSRNKPAFAATGSPPAPTTATHSTPAVTKALPKSYEADIHFQRMQIYKEAPWWWYTALLLLAFFAGLIVVLKGETTLPVWGYILALIVGTIVTPFSNIMVAKMGSGVATNQLMKMIAGAVHPGKPVANLYFSMWSHDVVSNAVSLAADLKGGQYLKIPPRIMFFAQVWGTLVGCFINYFVMVAITTNQHDVLLDPQGTNVWSGYIIQAHNSEAVTWSLSSQMFGLHSRYIWVPLGLLLGAIPTTIQYLIWRRYPKIGPISLDSIVIPIIYENAAYVTIGINSVVVTSIIVGVVSQVWIRKYHPGWFRKYMYLVGGALDGGAQIIVFILGFAVFGTSGTERPFPTWWGNPLIETNNVDYCINTNLVPPTP